MKVVILAGGKGQRIIEETKFKPKPMIEIGNKPILWHIMKLFSYYGFNDFIICSGYKSDHIKQYFYNYFINSSDLTFDLKNNEIIIHKNLSEPWKVTIIDTGLNSMTGGRLLRIKDYINEDNFFMTYGDGVCNINLHHLLSFYLKNNSISTISLYQPSNRFGIVSVDENTNYISCFKEKPIQFDSWINIGYMILNREVFNYIKDDRTVLEHEPLENLANDKKLIGYKHNGLWHCMDTINDKYNLEKMWADNNAFWKVWE